MVGGPFHERPRGGDQRLDDRQSLRDRQGVAVAAAGGQHHPHPCRPHPVDRPTGGVGHLMPAVGDRAIDVEHEQSDRAGGRCGASCPVWYTCRA